MFVDAHCHLDFFQRKEIPQIIQQAKKQNVAHILTNGVNQKTNRRALELAETYAEVNAALGMYPIETLKLTEQQFKDELGFIQKNREKIICIGEVGLDYKEDEKQHKKQQKRFQGLIELALKLDKPLTIHSRKAEADAIKMLEQAQAKKVIMHYFSGKIKLVDQILKNNWLLTIPTSVTRNQHFERVIEKTPLTNLLCETDSPHAHPDREFPNTPKNIKASYKAIAKLKKISLKKVETQVEKNFKELFAFGQA